MLETIAVWFAGKLVVPVLDRATTVIGRDAPKWVHRIKLFVRFKQLQSRVSSNELMILACIMGRQQDYAFIERALAGRLEGDALLHAVTSLQALGLLNQPRLSHPPDPSALFTVSADAELLVKLNRTAKTAKPRKARRSDIPEATARRNRLASNQAWLAEYGDVARRSDYLPVERTDEARQRLADASEDEAWLEHHGFGTQ